MESFTVDGGKHRLLEMDTDMKPIENIQLTLVSGSYVVLQKSSANV